MKLIRLLALLSLSAVAGAHRLDEYLQAIAVSIAPGHMTAQMRLIPGVAVAKAVISAIDANHDGVFSPAEQARYAQEVLADLLLRADGQPVRPHLASLRFPSPADLTGGEGEIRLEFVADLPNTPARHTITIENHFEPRFSVYLMNCFTPQDARIHLRGQNRNRNQSVYDIEYTERNSAL